MTWPDFAHGSYVYSKLQLLFLVLFSPLLLAWSFLVAKEINHYLDSFHSFIQKKKYVLSPYHVPGTALDIENTFVNEIDKDPLGDQGEDRK